MGQCHQYLGDQQNAIKFFNKVIKLSKEDGDLASESMAYGNLAKSFIYTGNDVEASNSIQKGKELADKSNYYSSLINVTLAKLMYQIKKEDYKSAMTLAEDTIKQIEEKNDKDNAPIAYRLYANALNGLRLCDNALNQIDKAIEIAKEDKYPRELAWALMVKGTILENLKNKEQAKLATTEAKQIAITLKDKTLLSILS
jgi:tetratricopeptide (TPR) repeat protein